MFAEFLVIRNTKIKLRLIFCKVQFSSNMPQKNGQEIDPVLQGLYFQHT